MDGNTRFSFGLEPYKLDHADYWPEYIWRTIDPVVSQAGGTASIHGEVFSPWTQMMELLGYENGLMALLDDANKCRDILAAYTRCTVDLAGPSSAARFGCNSDIFRICRSRVHFTQSIRRILYCPTKPKIVKAVHNAGIADLHSHLWRDW